MVENLVSVIIPCYNAQEFVTETIESVLNQSYQSLEIIVIDDGSNDNTEAKVLSFIDNRITYIRKINTGVSDTRNKGLEVARGNYVLFLDADDVLGRDFLEKRLEQLIQNPEALFSCGKVIKINEQGQIVPGTFRGTAEHIYRDVLLYDPEIITCPSNYLFRKMILDKHGLVFNTNLSSTADRYFLIELAALGKGAAVDNGGELYYRVSGGSMSHQVSLPLVDDNEKFYKAVFAKNNVIPDEVFKQFQFKINYILGASYMSLKIYGKGFVYFFYSFFYKPVNFTSNLLRKLF